MLWKGPFLRLPEFGAARQASPIAATYLYEGREIDQQDHLGVDLASLAALPVPAANSGAVVYTGVLASTARPSSDHGFGFSACTRT